MREEKRELYREGTPDNLKKGYTDLIYAGSGVEVEKGVISADGEGGSGGEGGGFFIFHTTNVNEYTYQLDKTWNEIKDALESNLIPIEFVTPAEDEETPTWIYYYVVMIQHNPDGYTVQVIGNGNLTTYITDDPDGLPTYIED